MSKNNFDAAIRNLVGEEIERSLVPYRELLAQIADFVGMPSRGPVRPAREVAEPAGGRGRRRVVRRAGKGDASQFREGQTVQYKQGRGIFEATVVAIDTERNVVTIERAKDHKQVDRPAAKVYSV
jgi:hypothetical protein